MNSKGHLILSLVKSFTRIVSCILAIVFSSKSPTSVIILSAGLLLSELLGIFEELVDYR